MIEKQSSEKTNLLAEEVVNDISTHPGQAYDMSLRYRIDGWVIFTNFI